MASRGSRGRAPAPQGGGAMDGRMVALSKSLSWLLRHGAAEVNVAMDSEGYVLWDEIRALKQFKGYALEDVVHVVENNSKKRFHMCGDGLFLSSRPRRGGVSPARPFVSCPSTRLSFLCLACFPLSRAPSCLAHACTYRAGAAAARIPGPQSMCGRTDRSVQTADEHHAQFRA